MTQNKPLTIDSEILVDGDENSSKIIITVKVKFNSKPDLKKTTQIIKDFCSSYFKKRLLVNEVREKPVIINQSNECLIFTIDYIKPAGHDSGDSHIGDYGLERVKKDADSLVESLRFLL